MKKTMSTGNPARRLAYGAMAVLVLAAQPAFGEQPSFTNKEIGFVAKPPFEAQFQRVRTDVLSSIKTVGVMPMELVGGEAMLPGAAQAIARMENDLVQRLTAAGFKVVPPAAMHASREVAAGIAGNLFDPVTGEADELKLEQYQQLLWKDYRSRNTVDGYVMSAVMLRPAKESSGGSTWDGVTDSTTGLGALASLMSGSKREMAVVPALSLVMWLTDANQRVEYHAAGGLHLLMYLRKPPGLPVDYVEVAAGPELLSPTRVTRAMDVIFEPILKSQAQIEAEKKQRKGAPRYSLQYAPALGERAPDGSEFITQADFQARYQGILIMPLRWSSDARTGEAARQFEQMLADRLTALGKTVIPPNRVLEAMALQMQSSKMSYDGRSGALDRASFDSIKSAGYTEIARTTPFEAVLHATIVERPALFEAGEAHWLGTRQYVTGDATALEAKLSPAGRKLGTVTALALQLRLTDLNDKVLYEGSGGIELSRLLEANGFVNRSAWDMLTDKERNAAAIDLALGRLVKEAKK